MSKAAQLKKYCRKGRKPVQPVDQSTTRELISSEDTTQISYQWNSQDDPYALLVEDAPLQPFSQPEGQPAAGHLAADQPVEAPDSSAQSGKDALDAFGELLAPTGQQGAKPQAATRIVPSKQVNPVSGASSKRRAVAHPDQSKPKLLQNSQVGSPVCLQLGMLPRQQDGGNLIG